MKGSVLHILMYLFKNHMQENCLIMRAEAQLTEELEQAGFQPDLIHHALTWLENLSQKSNEATLINPSDTSMRIYLPYECELLDIECRRFILLMEQQGILTPHMREIVIELVIALESEEIDVNLIKWVTLMALYNQEDSREALEYLEMLVLNETSTGEH